MPIRCEDMGETQQEWGDGKDNRGEDMGEKKKDKRMFSAFSQDLGIIRERENASSRRWATRALWCEDVRKGVGHGKCVLIQWGPYFSNIFEVSASLGLNFLFLDLSCLCLPLCPHLITSCVLCGFLPLSPGSSPPAA